MKKKIWNPSVLILAFTLVLVSFSCNPGTGCLINESAHVKMGKDGKLPNTRGSSSLFGKKFYSKKKKKKK